jgi:hypothetical protein
VATTPNSVSGNFRASYAIFQRGHRTLPPHPLGFLLDRVWTLKYKYILFWWAFALLPVIFKYIQSHGRQVWAIKASSYNFLPQSFDQVHQRFDYLYLSRDIQKFHLSNDSQISFDKYESHCDFRYLDAVDSYSEISFTSPHTWLLAFPDSHAVPPVAVFWIRLCLSQSFLLFMPVHGYFYLRQPQHNSFPFSLLGFALSLTLRVRPTIHKYPCFVPCRASLRYFSA